MIRTTFLQLAGGDHGYHHFNVAPTGAIQE